MTRMISLIRTFSCVSDVTSLLEPFEQSVRFSLASDKAISRTNMLVSSTIQKQAGVERLMGAAHVGDMNPRK